MSRAGETRIAVSSAVVVGLKKTVYFEQDRANTNYVKIGQTGGSIASRKRSLRTASPEGMHSLACVRCSGDREYHDRFSAARVRPDGEWFRLAPVWAFICSPEFDALHGIRLAEPLKERETCEQWLARVGTSEANHNLREIARLRAIVPPEAGGGWVLWEFCSGVGGRVDAPTIGRAHRFSAPLFEYASISPGPPQTVVRVYGEEFRFFIFAEACERASVPPAPGAIRTGVTPRCPRVARVYRRAASK